MLCAHATHAAPSGSAAGWVLAALLGLVPWFAYVRAVGVRRAAGRSWPRWRTACFGAGLVLVAAAVSPALPGLGTHDPRAHMVQHLLLGMFAPLALVLAATVTLLLGALPVARRGAARRLLRSRLLRRVAHPVPAAVLDMGGLYLLHLTPLHGLIAHPVGQQLVNLHFLLAGYLFTWSVAGPDPAPRRPGTVLRAGVLVGAGAHAHLAKLLYARAAELPSAQDVDAAQGAAQLMYYGGDLAELALAVVLFGTWYRTRRSRTRSPRSTHQVALRPPRPPTSDPWS